MNARIEKKKYKKLYEQATRQLKQRMLADALRQHAYTPKIETIKFKKLVRNREIMERGMKRGMERFSRETEEELEKAICDYLITHGSINIKVERNDIMDAQEFTAWLHVAKFPNEL